MQSPPRGAPRSLFWCCSRRHWPPRTPPVRRASSWGAVSAVRRVIAYHIFSCFAVLCRSAQPAPIWHCASLHATVITDICLQTQLPPDVETHVISEIICLCCHNPGRTLQGSFGVSAQDAITFAQGAVAAASGGDCGQSQTALRLAESSPAVPSGESIAQRLPSMICSCASLPVKQSCLPTLATSWHPQPSPPKCMWQSVSIFKKPLTAVSTYTDIDVRDAIRSAHSKIAATPCGNPATRLVPDASFMDNSGRRLRQGA